MASIFLTWFKPDSELKQERGNPMGDEKNQPIKVLSYWSCKQRHDPTLSSTDIPKAH